MKDLPLKFKGLLLATTPLIFGIAFVLVLLILLRQAELETVRETRSKNMIISAQAVLFDMYQVAVSLMRYRISTSPEQLDISDQYLRQARVDLEDLRKSVEQEPSEINTFRKNEAMILRQLDGMTRRKTALRQGLQDPLSTEQKLVHYREMGEVVEYFRALADRQKKLAAQQVESSKRTRSAVVIVIICGLLGNLVVGTAAALLFSKGILKRIDVLSENAQRLSKSETLIPVLPGKDEIAQLDKVFHSMADKLTEAIAHEKAVIDNAPDLICTVDGAGLFLRVNPSVEAVLLQPASALIGGHCNVLLGDKFPNPDSQADECKFWSQLECGNETMHLSWTAQWSQGEERYFCVGRNVTAEYKLQQFKKELMEMVSHDLRTPLSSIRTALELVLEGTYGQVTEPINKRLTSVNTNISSLVKLVNELLDIHRSEAGSLPLHRSLACASLPVNSAVDSLKPLAEKRGIEIIAEVPRKDVYMDAARIEQVLANLLGNAIRYSPDNSKIRVNVTLEKDTAEFHVCDYGRGVPRELQDSIFDRFSQVDPDDKRDRQGSGLGLAIAKAIVVAHGGSIGVISKDGEGSVFWFRIPRANEVEALACPKS